MRDPRTIDPDEWRKLGHVYDLDHGYNLRDFVQAGAAVFDCGSKPPAGYVHVERDDERALFVTDDEAAVTIVEVAGLEGTHAFVWCIETGALFPIPSRPLFDFDDRLRIPDFESVWPDYRAWAVGQEKANNGADVRFRAVISIEAAKAAGLLSEEACDECGSEGACIEGCEKRGTLDERRNRCESLDEWLAKHEARCLWQQRIQNVGLIECWAIRGCPPFIVQRYGDGTEGWDIYISADVSSPIAYSSIAYTLARAERLLGLHKKGPEMQKIATAERVRITPGLVEWIRNGLLDRKVDIPDDLEKIIAESIESTGHYTVDADGAPLDEDDPQWLFDDVCDRLGGLASVYGVSRERCEYLRSLPQEDAPSWHPLRDLPECYGRTLAIVTEGDEDVPTDSLIAYDDNGPWALVFRIYTPR